MILSLTSNARSIKWLNHYIILVLIDIYLGSPLTSKPQIYPLAAVVIWTYINYRVRRLNMLLWISLNMDRFDWDEFIKVDTLLPHLTFQKANSYPSEAGRNLLQSL